MSWIQTLKALLKADNAAIGSEHSRGMSSGMNLAARLIDRVDPQLTALTQLAELIQMGRVDQEATSFPYWIIAINAGILPVGVVQVSHGFWFNRKDAQDHLDACPHRYSKKAFVYCQSGHMSSHTRLLYELARQGLEKPAPFDLHILTLPNISPNDWQARALAAEAALASIKEQLEQQV